MKIQDIGGNILLFKFDDALDLERVLELEPWTYDKSLAVFRRAVNVESAPLLPFDSVTFWVQLHNVPDQCHTQATGEVVGNTIGALVQVADLEDDGEGGEFLRIRVVIDIKKLLPRAHGKPSWKKGPAMERQQPTTNDLISKDAHGSDFGKGGVKENIQSEVFTSLK
nr:hypothetical protein CFP56_36546 [Quercus suber]